MKQPNKQQLIYGASILVGGVFLYSFWNKLFGKSAADLAKDAADAQAKKLKDIELAKAKQTSKLTRPESEYFTAANIIHDSLMYSSLDDDADAAQRSFTSIINTPADLAYLNVIYGTRPLYNFGFLEGSFDLIQTLAREFSSNRKNETIAILAKKGVYISL